MRPRECGAYIPSSQAEDRRLRKLRSLGAGVSIPVSREDEEIFALNHNRRKHEKEEDGERGEKNFPFDETTAGK